jgi:hypothetical protein
MWALNIEPTHGLLKYLIRSLAKIGMQRKNSKTKIKNKTVQKGLNYLSLLE